MTRTELIEKMAMKLHEFYKKQSSGWDIKFERMDKSLKQSFKDEAEYMLKAIEEAGLCVVDKRHISELYACHSNLDDCHAYGLYPNHMTCGMCEFNKKVEML